MIAISVSVGFGARLFVLTSCLFITFGVCVWSDPNSASETALCLSLIWGKVLVDVAVRLATFGVPGVTVVIITVVAGTLTHLLVIVSALSIATITAISTTILAITAVSTTVTTVVAGVCPSAATTGVSTRWEAGSGTG
jgi:hypothetical protein